jgi:hypothetical protein
MTLQQLLILAVIILVSGLIGGYANALFSRQGRSLAGEQSETGQQRLGAWQTTLAGGLAAFLSWGIYGPLAQLNLADLKSYAEFYGITLATIGGAFFVGFGGARWLTAESDKIMLNKGSNSMATGAANAAGGAAMIAQSTGELVDKAATLAKDAASQANLPDLEKQADNLADTAQQVMGQAQQLTEHSNQLQAQAQQIQDAQTPVQVLNSAQEMQTASENVATSAEQVEHLVDKNRGH